MDERPFPHGPLPQPPPSRRGFIVVGALAAVAAGGGVWFAASSEGDSGSSAPPTVSQALRAAAQAERDLLATVTAALKHAHGSHRAALQTLRADHTAHLHAVEAAIADALYPGSPSTSASPSGAHHTAAPGKVRIAEVRAAEQKAAGAAAARAAALTGRAAALLASISACEATHAELLSGVGT
jgi:hypothetical protein